MHTLIYGGTFDPIHHGHLITCQRARELLNADRVVFIPAFISPHKRHQQSASGEHRLAMLHAAIADHAFFLADARELQRGESEGRPSYTIETIESLRAENPTHHLTLLLGQDQLPKLHTWHHIHELINMIKFAILSRPPQPPQTPTQNTPNTPRETSGEPHPSVEIDPLSPGKARENAGKDLQIVAQTLGQEAAARLKILHTPLIQISSTDLRERIRQGLPIDFLVPPPVADYIQKHGLYRTE